MTAALRRGFKSLAETISAELRAELSLCSTDRLDCRRLAKHLGLPVAPVTDLTAFGVRARDLEIVLAPEMTFSALTVCRGSRKAIFYNPRHSPRRRANSLAHEISHVVLEHEPGPAISDGKRIWNAGQENEANWLAGALLVPRDGALALLSVERSFEQAADHFGVSDELFRWRANHTGVVRQLSRRRGSRTS